MDNNFTQYVDFSITNKYIGKNNDNIPNIVVALSCLFLYVCICLSNNSLDFSAIISIDFSFAIYLKFLFIVISKNYNQQTNILKNNFTIVVVN